MFFTPPLVLLHISAAVIGLLSGFMTMFVRKGAGMHRVAGTVFTVSMLTMSASGAYLAVFTKPNGLNLIVALLTFYLVATGWWAGRRREGATGRFDFGGLVFVLVVAAVGAGFGFEAANSPTGTRDGLPAASYFFLGAIALLFAISDVRTLRRGLAGSRRLARHLWRMSLVLLVATFSFLPGQARQLPVWLRKERFMYIPHMLLIAMIVYWLFRVRRNPARVLKKTRALQVTTIAGKVAGA
jgi:uncharacterized membrane protein